MIFYMRYGEKQEIKLRTGFFVQEQWRATLSRSVHVFRRPHLSQEVQIFPQSHLPVN